MSTSEGFPYPADITIRSQFLTASDILTAKKRQLVSASYMSDLRQSKNLTQKSMERVVDVRAAIATVVQDMADRSLKTPFYHTIPRIDLLSRAPCCPSFIAVSIPQ